MDDRQQVSFDVDQELGSAQAGQEAIVGDDDVLESVAVEIAGVQPEAESGLRDFADLLAAVENATGIAKKARHAARVVNEVEVAVKFRIDQLEAIVREHRHVGGNAAVAERSIAVVEQETRAEQEIDEAILVEVHGLATPRDIGRAGGIRGDAGRHRDVREHAGAVVHEEPVAGTIAARLVIGCEQVDVSVIVEIGGEQRATDAAYGKRRYPADVWKLPLPWLTCRSAIEPVTVAREFVLLNKSSKPSPLKSARRASPRTRGLAIRSASPTSARTRAV